MRNYEEEKQAFITREEYRRLKPKKKLKLKSWVKNTLWFILGIATAMIIQDMVNTTERIKTPAGSEYTCSGRIIKVCAGSTIAE